MNLIKPEKLNIGDTIAIIALCGAVKEQENILRAKKYFEQLGYNVKLASNIFDKNRYLAGDDDKKINELHGFFKDSSVKMILNARGGYGAIRLIDKIDYQLVKNNPKIFAGYSDVSALNLIIFKKTGLITFHSPMASGDFGVEKVSRFTEKDFFKTVAKSEVQKINADKNAIIYSNGKAEGILWGGNLATIASLCGQDFIPDEKFIFFTEDLNEEAYKIDKMFTQLLNIKEFRKNLNAIILGDFLGVKDKTYLNDFFQELSNNLSIPIIKGFRITHAKKKITLPVGAKAHLDTNNLTLQVDRFLR